MGKYFVAPYSTYYEKLVSSSILVSAQKLSVDCNEVSSIVDKLQSSLTSSSWKELGFNEIVSNSIPLLKTNVSSLCQNVNSSLVPCCEKTMNTLVPLLQNLKDKDELYSQKESDLSNLNSNIPTKYIKKDNEDTNTYTSEYSNYLSKKSSLESEISSLNSELLSIKINCDSVINDLKGLTGSQLDVIDISLPIDSDDITVDDLIEAGGIISDDMTTTDFDTNAPVGKTVLYNDVGGYESGYSRKILTSHGKYVTVFQQAWNNKSSKYRYNDVENDPKSLSSSGCGYNALASIMSSKFPNITPEQLFLEMGRKSLYASDIKKHLENNYGIKVGYRDDFSDSDDKKRKIIQEVNKGNMVICTVDGRTDSKYTKQGHWVSIVDYDPETDMFYVTDSNDQDDSNAPPIDATRFLRDYEINSNIIYIADDSSYVEKA